MPYAVELYFDTDAERRIRHLWQAIATAGVRFIPLEIGARPHSSLTAFDEVDASALMMTIQSLSRQNDPLEILFASIGCFARDHGVVFIASVVHADLLAQHSNFHNLLHRSGLSSNSLYVPGNWVAHCTIAP